MTSSGATPPSLSLFRSGVINGVLAYTDLGLVYSVDPLSPFTDANIDANAKFVVNDIGRVGIGVTTPTSLLHTVDGGAPKTANYTGVLHAVSSPSVTASINKIGMDIESTGAWTGASAVNTGLVVNATGGTTNYAATFNGGNVGIGTTTPTSTLSVNGNISAVGGITLTPGVSTNLNIQMDSNQSAGAAYFGDIRFGAGRGYDLFFQTGGSNHARIRGGQDGSTNSMLALYTDAEALRINSNGDVGIGTTTPGAKLEVAGAVKITGGSPGAGKVLTSDATGLASWTTASAGTVTSVTSANPYLTVATTTSTPVITAVVGTAANTLAAGNDARFTDSRAPNGPAGGDLSGTFPNPAVAKIQGTSVSATAPTTTGQVLRYNGATWAASMLSMFDLRSTISGSATFGAGCTSGQTLTWTVATDNLSCTNISLPVAQITGTLPATNGGTGQNTFAVGDLLYASTTTALSKLPASTAGYVLTTNGAGTAPTWTAPSGGLPAAPGTAAAPGYAFSGDTDTGMFGAAANQIGFATNGSERMRIDTNGVGIAATTDSSAALTIGSGGSTFALSLSNANTGGIPWYVGSSQNSWSSGGGKFLISKTTTASGAALAIDGATNYVGIGTTSPSVPLDIKTPSVIGYPAFKATDYTDTSGVQIQSVSGGNYRGISADSYYYSGGNPGGTYRSSSTTSSMINLYGGQMSFYTDAGISSSGFTPTNRMTILSSGNIGIGTTAPNSLLSVEKGNAGGPGGDILIRNTSETANSSATLKFKTTFDNTDNYQKGSIAYVSLGGYGKGDMYFLQNSAGDSSNASLANVVMDIANNGNIGMGTTSPRRGLDVSNGALVTKAATSNGSSTINFATGNLQYTAASCGAFQMNNLTDGGTYMFVVQGATSGTCTFTGFSDAGTTALTVHMPPDNGPTTASKHTIYNMTVLGTHVYVAWTPGY